MLCFYMKQLEHMLILTLKIHLTLTFITFYTYISCLTQSYNMPYSVEEVFHTFPTIMHGSTQVL